MASMYPPSPFPGNNILPMPGAPMMGAPVPQPGLAQMQQPGINPHTYPIEVERGEHNLPKREIEHASSVLDKVRRSRKKDAKQFEKIVKWRQYAAGNPGDDGLEQTMDPELYDDAPADAVRANLVHSTFKSLLPVTAARNPEIACAPAERLNDNSYADIRPFARTSEIYINHSFRSGRFKRQLRRTTIAANTSAIGWLKVMYQRDYVRDALVQHRIDDAQDNIARLRQLIEETNPNNREQDPDELMVRMSELDQVVRGLQEQVEIQVAEGWVFDRIRTEDLIVDGDIEELEDYLDADMITHQVYVEAREAAARFGLTDEEGRRRFATASRFGAAATDAKAGSEEDPNGDKVTMAEAPGKGGKRGAFVRVLEVWCKTDRVVYTLIEGMKGWAREPYRPKVVGRRFYPFFALRFNEVDGRRWPLSDTELMAKLADEYNTNRDRLREHRERAVPFRIGRRSDVTEEDAKKINGAQPMELVLVDGPDDESKPLQSSIAEFAYPTLDPALYDVTQIRADIDQVVGSTDLFRGAQMGDRTATAAAIQNEGLQSRVTDRQDVVEDFVAEIAEYMLQMSLQLLTFQQVQRVVGEGTAWPGIEVQQPMVVPGPGGQPIELAPGKNTEFAWLNELAREDVFDLIMVEVRAGSTGRPNRALEAQQWRELWPLIDATIQQVYQLRLAGQFDMASAKIQLLKEMLRRLDERLDVERFIPEVDPQQMMLMQMQAQMAGQQAGAGGQGGPGGVEGGGAPPGPGGLIQPGMMPPQAA